MGIELTKKKVKCRKDRLCEWCGESIYKGADAVYRSGVFDGHMHSGHQHPECYDAMVKSDNSDFDDDGGFNPYEQKRGMTMHDSHA